ncbi:hypothetical protein [Microbacterium sp. Cr-K29]|uniref:hypothetical protein n=1 Tax=Microbacterium sp. Cr-K29 TaxID=1452534 RepID=UPI000AFDF2E2|nr:hypothetical protein [Microbacterium sp. Cr-K29]
MSPKAQLYFRFIIEAAARAHALRWTEGPRTDVEDGASPIRGSRAEPPGCIADELADITLDFDGLGVADLGDGLPRWTANALDDVAVAALLGIREHRTNLDIDAAAQHRGSARPQAARRALRAWAMPAEEHGAARVYGLFRCVQVRTARREDDGSAD